MKNKKLSFGHRDLCSVSQVQFVLHLYLKSLLILNNGMPSYRRITYYMIHREKEITQFIEINTQLEINTH